MRLRTWERFSAFAYWITLVTVRLIMLGISRLEIVHPERVTPEGRIVIVGNHRNSIDPILVCVCAPRRLRVMAKRELFELPLIGWTLWAFGAFPVRRYSADIGALRVGRNYLRNEHPNHEIDEKPQIPNWALKRLLEIGVMVPIFPQA